MIENQKNRYSTRDERNKFIAEDLKKYIGIKVLNFGGGGKKHLKKYLPSDINYLELDIAGEPDIKCNLEKELPIKTENNSFDTVIATDVLEHLENHIEVLEEMIRISDKYIILSLPNCWVQNKNKLFKENATSGKFYGFPVEKPEDRHKWHFSAVEAEEFYRKVSYKYNLEVSELFHIGYFHNSLLKNCIRFITEKLFGKEVRINNFTTAIWCVLEKRH